MSGVVIGPRRLWVVTQTAAVTNERLLGITGPNPLRIVSGIQGAVFGFKVTAKNNITLNNITVYGAIDVEGNTPQGFPGPGLIQLSLAYTNSNLGIFQGIIHPAHLQTGEAGDALTNYVAAPALPNGLLLEYTTSAPGAAPTVTFEVWLIGVGPKAIDRV